ncbi:MAG: ABC transporter ATP-binding protein/permease [Coriobacteriia bacterium]|nr:ABC transporter ATP-binding protein/permease [Coriobacteriia bacterium]
MTGVILKKYIEKIMEATKIRAVIRLFSFVEVRRSEIAGLVTFVVISTLLEGVGLTLLLPILQYAEGGSSAIQNSGGFYWEILANALAVVGLQPTLVVLLILAFVPIVLRNVTFYLKTWYGAVVSSRIMLRLRMKVVDVVYSADPEFYTRHPVGQLVGVVMGQTGTAGGAVLSVINLFGTVLLLLMYVAILLILSVPLTLVALFFALIVTAVNRRVLAWISKNALKNARLGQKLMGKITERMGQMQLIKLRFTKDQESENIREVSETMRGLGIKASRVGASVEVIVDPVQMLSVFATLYIGIAVLGSTLAQLGLLLFILLRLNAKVKEFNGAIRGITAAASGITLTREMFDAAIESNTITSGPQNFEPLKRGISFKNVSFDYPDVYNAQGELVSRGKPVLKGVDAEIPVGSFTAVVGRSGAGKSTLVELFPRMRDVTGGTLQYDGVDIKDFDVKSLRRSIGYVTQTPMLFNDTVYDNITYGLGYEPTEQQIRSAMEAAHATFVYDLPHGLETQLGDRGVRFSGGERQRISLARVLLEDNEVLVFDEPTSALDSESEGYIQQTLAELHGKKTLIVIAHRLSTIVAADQLLVMDDGQIVESGSHQALMTKGGAYAKLFESQMIEMVDV